MGCASPARVACGSTGARSMHSAGSVQCAPATPRCERNALATRVDLTPVRRAARVTGAAVRCGGRHQQTDRAQHSTSASGARHEARQGQSRSLTGSRHERESRLHDPREPRLVSSEPCDPYHSTHCLEVTDVTDLRIVGARITIAYSWQTLGGKSMNVRKRRARARRKAKANRLARWQGVPLYA
jgi:hypothetical protein